MFRDLKPVITLVAVAENPRDITSGNEDMFQEEVADLKKHIAEAMEVCEQEQVSAESMLLEGDPRKMLLFAAEKKVHPDMLVIAIHRQVPADPDRYFRHSRAISPQTWTPSPAA